MKTLMIGTATLALLIGAPATAQRLGGVGGIGAMGGVGPIGGQLGGGVNGTLGSTVTDATAQARDEARRADRATRRAARQNAKIAPTNVTGSATLSGNATAAPADTSVAAAATRVALTTPGVQTRGIVAATGRGLTRVSETASGVPVFVASSVVAPAAAVATPAVTAYPVYRQGVYYGGDVAFVSSGEVGGYVGRQYEDLSRDLRGTGATVYRRGDDLVLRLPADVTFAFDKSDIQPRFVGPLNAVARTLGAYRATDVEIVGHTDSIGSDRYNLALSERRGRSVADFLVERSTDPSRLVVEAMGKSEPIASNATIAGRAANRRVEIVFHPRVG